MVLNTIETGSHLQCRQVRLCISPLLEKYSKIRAEDKLSGNNRTFEKNAEVSRHEKSYDTVRIDIDLGNRGGSGVCGAEPGKGQLEGG